MPQSYFRDHAPLWMPFDQFPPQKEWFDHVLERSAMYSERCLQGCQTNGFAWGTSQVPKVSLLIGTKPEWVNSFQRDRFLEMPHGDLAVAQTARVSIAGFQEADRQPGCSA